MFAPTATNDSNLFHGAPNAESFDTAQKNAKGRIGLPEGENADA